jgi:hypothetical protein
MRRITLRIRSHDADALERLEFSDKEIRDPHAYDGPYHPHFHFSPRLGWMNDINGSFYQDGLYHIFYQFNPASTAKGTGFDMHWGHAVSRDLVHWGEWPIALFPNDCGQCFSGSTVMQQYPIPGVNEGVKLPAPAMFFAATRPFSQHLATTPDGGRTWKRYAGNPVVPFNQCASLPLLMQMKAVNGEDTLYASYGNNKGSENTAGEEARGRVSADGGKTWSAVFTIATPDVPNLGIRHGVFLSRGGELWSFHGAFYGNKLTDITTSKVHTRAYRLADALLESLGFLDQAGVQLDFQVDAGATGAIVVAGRPQGRRAHDGRRREAPRTIGQSAGRSWPARVRRR